MMGRIRARQGQGIYSLTLARSRQAAKRGASA